MADLIPAVEMKREFRGTSDQYWATLRHKGGGPEYIKVGPRKVYYDRASVEAWLEANRLRRRRNASRRHHRRPTNSRRRVDWDQRLKICPLFPRRPG